MGVDRNRNSVISMSGLVIKLLMYYLKFLSNIPGANELIELNGQEWAQYGC